jgi:glycosyltransferase involved in cell wall biosynthesis
MPTEKPRVLHVIARYNIGGTARYLNNLFSNISSEAEMLLAVGHVEGHEIEDSSLENVHFERIEHLGRKINPIVDLRAYLELRKLVKRYKPQIIHSHTFKAGLLSRLMFFRIPKVHTFHGHLMGDPEFSKRALQVIINIERRLAKVTKHIITVGEQVATDLISVGVGKSAQYRSIASEGVKLNFLTRHEARKLLNLGLDSPVVLWMARMAPVKNPSLALEVARALPNINFLIAGGGDLYEEIKEKATANVFMLGWVNSAEVIPAADVFLSTSLNEGIPYTLLEAKSCNIPIVAVNSGAVSEAIVDSIDGILTTDNVEEIAQSIERILKTEGNFAIGLKPEKILETKIGLSDMASKHLEIYKNITKS